MKNGTTLTSPKMVIKRESSPRAKSPPPKKNTGRSKAEDRSQSPFQKAKQPAASVLQSIEKIVATTVAAIETESAFASVQDTLFLSLFVASFAVFFALEYNGTLEPVHSFAQARLQSAENSAFLFVKDIFNKRVRSPEVQARALYKLCHYCQSLPVFYQAVPFLSAILVMSGVLSVFFYAIKFFARWIVRFCFLICVVLALNPFASQQTNRDHPVLLVPPDWFYCERVVGSS